MDRAYSLLEIKAVDEDAREIEGWATTPTPDRVGDVVDPLGAKFSNPLSLLWMHRHDAPVGEATFGKPTAKGIPFKARIAKITEPGILKDRVDEAWQSVKARLVRAVSIGFRSLEHSYMDTGGIRFSATEILELSLVTVPANAEATITAIKAIDTVQRAASGHSAERVVRLDGSRPGVSGNKTNPPKREESNMSKQTLQEQIAAFEAKRAAHVARMGEIMEKSAEKGETLDAAEAEEHDNLATDVAAIDKHIGRLKSSESLMVTRAAPVVQAPPAGQEGVEVKGSVNSRVTVTPRKAPGMAFAQFAKCIAIGKLDAVPATEIAKARYGDDPRIEAVVKAVVSAANTGTANNAGFLVGDEGSIFADFVDYLRPQTILGRFGAGGVPSLRQVPFRVPLLSQTSGGDGYWVGEGAGKPLTQFLGARTTLEPLKVANIAVATMELLRDSSPSAELWLRDQLAAALRERLDLDFIDPAKTAAATSPASITNGATTVASSGTDADAVRNDVRALFNAFIAANNAPTSGVWIMPTTTALSLSLMVNTLGQTEFPGIGMNGGSFMGLPVIASQYVPADSSGAVVALVNASDIYLADEGGIAVDMSREASLQMLDGSSAGAGAPTVNSVTPTATALVSMWQTNSVAFRAERTVNWARRRTEAVAYLTGVNWAPGA